MAQIGILRGEAEPSEKSKFAVELRHVSKSHGENQVYADLHFQLLHGTFVAAVGPIGSGKTTLTNMLAGMERPTSGSIIVEGTEITKLGEDDLTRARARLVGYVPQVQSLIPELTIAENVELPLRFLGMDVERRVERLGTVLDRVGIRGDSGRKVKTLSVGERQLVSIARALVNDPPILILDEPTEALDPLISEVVLGLLRGDNILAGKTLFVTTHDRRVTEMARRTLRIRKRIP